MPKKVILFLSIVAFSLSYGLAEADLIINEILYSPTSKQWVEVYNNGDSDIDLTKYKILDSGASVNGHGISAAAGGSNLIGPQSFAIVAKVPDDFSGSSFQLFKSALGIKAGGDTVILRDTTGTVSDNTVAVGSDSAVNGNSLQLVDGSWSGSVPTPGAVNQISEVDDGASNDDDTGGDNSGISSGTISSKSTSSSSSKKASVAGYKTKVVITVPKIAFAGIPFELLGEAFNGGNTRISYGKYFWNFGDGNSKETRDKGNFSYTYSYEGDYVVSLEYYLTSSSRTPDATAKIAVKVVPASVSISKAGGQEDFFIELSNNSNYDIDISGWTLSSSGNNFVFPKNTNVLSKKRIRLSSKVTNFSIEDKNSLKLMTKEQEIAFDYASYVALESSSNMPVKIAENKIFPKVSKGEEEKRVEKNETSIEALLPEASVDNLLASAGANLGGPASAVESDAIQNSNNNSYLPMLISIIFIGASASAAYLVRQKKTVSKPGYDFKILDE